MFRTGQLVLLVTGLIAIPVGAEEGTDRFEFRSDPWVNLHHFLYHEARNSLRRDERLRGRVRTYPEDCAVVLDDDQAATWQDSLATYAGYGDRHLIFDADLRLIGETLIRGPDAFPTGSDAEPAYEALRRAMPLYLEHWWPAHDAGNRSRIEALIGHLVEYGSAMADALSDGYGVAWPASPILVDVTRYSGRHGAYATGNPNHIVLASGSDWYPGLLALDVLFHEAGHTLPFEDQILPRSEAAADAAGVEEGGVWHAFLFFVPSRAARQVLPPSHTPYAYRDGGPLASGRMSRFEPFIRAALDESDDLDQIFRLIHEARARDEQ